jgi:hypothetical protein
LSSLVTREKEKPVAQTFEGAAQAAVAAKEKAVVIRNERKLIDLLVSWAGAVVAVALIALGGAALYGGSFAIDNVRDRLEPQNIAFPPAEAMSPEETAEVGTFAGQTVDTGREAEAYSRYIGLHLTGINEGMTYAETSNQARGVDAEAEPELAASLNEKANTLFKGETLRAILLNAYGWWTVGQITMWVGIGAVIAGLVLAVFVGLGFVHARRT